MGGCISTKRQRYVLPPITSTNNNIQTAPINPKDFIFTSRKHEKLIKQVGDVGGRDFVIEECDDCSILLMDHSCQVTVDLCRQCLIVIGPCDGSVFLRDCKDCIVCCHSKQVRLRNCTNMSLWLFTSSEPALEQCTDIFISDNIITFPELSNLKQKAGFLAGTRNLALEPFDFNRSVAIKVPAANKQTLQTRISNLPNLLSLEL